MNTLAVLQNNLREVIHDESEISLLHPMVQGESIYLSVPFKLLNQDIKEAMEVIMNDLDADSIWVEEKEDKINILLSSQAIQKSWDQVVENPSAITESEKFNQIITIDMSSPNIAKPMSMVHFRSTILGNLTANIYKKKGAKVIKINHLGDWGIPLSSIILAVNKWGDIKKIEANPMIELDRLYRLYLENLQINPYLEEETLQTYKKLEYRNKKVYEVWQWLKDLSMVHFNEIYQKFAIEFDFIRGESFYAEDNHRIIELIEDCPKTTKKYNSIYITVDDLEILIQDIDGHSTYLARDLAAAYHRFEQFNFDKSLYFIGKEQAEHFKKLKLVLNELGMDWSDRIQHIGYSPVLLENRASETPSKQKTVVNNLINHLTEIAQTFYDAEPGNGEEIAVNSLIFETLDKSREEILTINVDVLEEIIRNDAYSVAKLCQKLNIIDSELTDQSINKITVNTETIELLWQLSLFNSKINYFLIHYDSMVITKYMSKLLETTHYYIQSVTLHDKIDNEKVNKNLIQLTHKVLVELCHLIGFKEINHI